MLARSCAEAAGNCPFMARRWFLVFGIGLLPQTAHSASFSASVSRPTILLETARKFIWLRWGCRRQCRVLVALISWTAGRQGAANSGFTHFAIVAALPLAREIKSSKAFIVSGGWLKFATRSLPGYSCLLVAFPVPFPLDEIVISMEPVGQLVCFCHWVGGSGPEGRQARRSISPRLSEYAPLSGWPHRYSLTHSASGFRRLL
jgi:hypothetical protein